MGANLLTTCLSILFVVYMVEAEPRDRDEKPEPRWNNTFPPSSSTVRPGNKRI